MSSFNYFLIYIAPFIVLIISILAAFAVAGRDKPIKKS